MQTRLHASTVMTAVRSSLPHGDESPDDPIVASWRRCLAQHRLEPDRIGGPTVLTATELIDHREPLGDLIALSRGELERLFGRLVDHDYVVMLTDAQGVAVAFRCGDPVLDACAAAGVLPGSIWSEESQGTNGIGLCLKERRAVSVVMDDHFAARLTGISCTVAPIFGEQGRLAGVLNVSTLRPSDRGLQGIVRQVVAGSARRIENLFFDRRHAQRTILRLSRQDDFCDGAAEARVALDAGGRVVDATPEASRLLGFDESGPIGLKLSELDGLDDWQGRVRRRGTSFEGACGRVFLRLDEPAVRPALVVPDTVSRARGGPTARRPLPAGAHGDGPLTLEELVGTDAAITRGVEIARRLLARGVPVLLHGETGCGKSALARALHDAAHGDRGGFVAINCAAIPAELIESELFGHRPGAFTGASRQGARGRLLEADGGTLFLDEIGDMPLALQTRLLQVLSDGEFVPVGGTRPVRVRFALVSASLHDIGRQVREGRFREDLYYRLNGATLALPPLRVRSDLGALIDRAFERAAQAAGLPCPRLQPPARRALLRHRWPGNLRELQHVARYAVAIGEPGAPVGVADLPPPLGAGSEAADAARRERTAVTEASVPLEAHGNAAPDSRHGAVLAALEREAWNITAAAARLGVSRATLHRRVRELGLARPGSNRGIVEA